MSTQPTDDGSPPPTPTAQRSEGGGPDGPVTPEIPDPHVNRRQMLQITGAMAGAAAVGTASADEDDEEDDYADEEVDEDFDDGLWLTADVFLDPDQMQRSAMVAAGPPAWILFAGVSMYDHITQTDSDDGNATLHLTATNADESMQRFDVLQSNHLTDSQTVANIEARHGVASAWEDGEDYEQGYQRALDRIRGYYEPHEAIRAELGAFTLLQLGFVSDAGTDEDDLEDSNWAADTAEYTGSEDNPRVRPTALDPDEDQPSGTVTLHDGTEYELQPDPPIRFWTHDGDGGKGSDEYETNLSELIENWDPDEGEVTVEGPDYEWTTSFNLGIPNVPDADLEGARVFTFSDFYEPFVEIEEKADEIAGNYDSDLTEQLFDGMDDGVIDSSQVRGVEGQARFMSGSTDATEDRYRLALLQMLDMDQSDLSQIASMTVEYEGYTDQTFEVIDDERTEVFKDPTDGSQTYQGQLFARETPVSGLQAGGEYAMGHSLVLVSGNADDRDKPTEISPNLQAERSLSDAGEDIDGAAYGPLGQTLCYSADDQVVMVDTGDLSVLWTESFNIVNDLDYGEEFVAVDTNDDIFLLDPDDGGIIRETADGESAFALELTPDEDYLLSGALNDPARAYSTDDLEEYFTAPREDETRLGPDGETFLLYNDAGPSELLDFHTRDVIAEYPDSENATSDAALSHSGEYAAIQEATDDTLYVCDMRTGEEHWSISEDHRTVAFDSHDNLIVQESNSYDLVVYDPATGDEIERLQDYDERVDDVGVFPRKTDDVDGAFRGALMFDAPTSSEIDMIRGVMEITEMTDSDGGEISPITDQTIEDIEAEAGRDIDEIVADIEEIEDADDITDLGDLNLILESEELDGSEIYTESENWDGPKYDSVDNEEYGNYIADVGDYLIEETDLYSDDDDDTWWPSAPSADFEEYSSLAGFVVIMLIVVSVVASVVTDFIPFLGN